jgi:hypothetical protein
VRNALVYVLQNWRKHVPGARGRDPRSSAAWFDGLRAGATAVGGIAPVVAARTWLARVGWRRHGPIDAREGPRTNVAVAKPSFAGSAQRPIDCEREAAWILDHRR